MREEVDAQREGDDRVVRREVLRMLQQRGPAYILGQVQVQAVKDVRGKFAGYMVVAVTAQAREVLGGALKEGDVITHLNGVRQRMPEDYLAAWKLLGTAEQVRIDFIREDALVAAVWRVEP
jgi:type II secretory pathway component PulC